MIAVQASHGEVATKRTAGGGGALVVDQDLAKQANDGHDASHKVWNPRAYLSLGRCNRAAARKGNSTDTWHVVHSIVHKSPSRSVYCYGYTMSCNIVFACRQHSLSDTDGTDFLGQ